MSDPALKQAPESPSNLERSEDAPPSQPERHRDPVLVKLEEAEIAATKSMKVTPDPPFKTLEEEYAYVMRRLRHNNNIRLATARRHHEAIWSLITREPELHDHPIVFAHLKIVRHRINDCLAQMSDVREKRFAIRAERAAWTTATGTWTAIVISTVAIVLQCGKTYRPEEHAATPVVVTCAPAVAEAPAWRPPPFAPSE